MSSRSPATRARVGQLVGDAQQAKNRRLVFAALALLAPVAAAVLAVSGLKDQATFFYAPSDLKRDGLPLRRSRRLGAMVQAGDLAAAKVASS